MKLHLWSAVLVCAGVWVVSAESQSSGAMGSLRSSLPLVNDLPAGYRSVGMLGDHGELYAAGTTRHRIDDGDAHHGLPATVAWAANPKDEPARTQGVHYKVEDGRVTATGYMVRQADLVAGHSFYGLTLHELDVPAAHRLTIELLDGDTEESPNYLFLWHFLPAPDQVRPMLQNGELQLLANLPRMFEVVRNENHPADFYPRMGRHRRDLSKTVNRYPTATGSESVWYGEAAGKLIFIEYIVSQQDLADGASWIDLPLNGVPIPPIDNVHILHYNGARPDEPGRYTVHMYFLPETQYLSWETEPVALETQAPQG